MPMAMESTANAASVRVRATAVAFGVIGALLGATRPADAGWITPIALPSSSSSHAYAVSADGGVVAAISWDGSALGQAIVWEDGQTSEIPLLVLPPPTAGWESHQHRRALLSDDGGTVVVDQASAWVDPYSFRKTLYGIAWRGSSSTLFAQLSESLAGSTSEAAAVSLVSRDGAYAFGSQSSYFHGIEDTLVYRWDTTTAVEDDFQPTCPPGLNSPNGYQQQRIAGASFDGLVVVGSSLCESMDQTFIAPRPFRLDGTTFTYPQRLGVPMYGTAEAVSADGSTVSIAADTYFGVQSWLWVGGQITQVADLPGMTGYLPRVWALSDDGSVVVGTAETIYGRAVFRWEGGTMEWVGDLPGGDWESTPTAMTPDASVIVGTGTTATGDEPFYWTAAGGIRRLHDVLEQEQGISLATWQLSTVTDVSDDGTVVVGWGTHLGSTVGYRADLATALPGVAGSVVGVMGLVSGLGVMGTLVLRRRHEGMGCRTA